MVYDIAPFFEYFSFKSWRYFKLCGNGPITLIKRQTIGDQANIVDVAKSLAHNWFQAGRGKVGAIKRVEYHTKKKT